MNNKICIICCLSILVFFIIGLIKSRKNIKEDFFNNQDIYDKLEDILNNLNHTEMYDIKNPPNPLPNLIHDEYHLIDRTIRGLDTMKTKMEIDKKNNSSGIKTLNEKIDSFSDKLKIYNDHLTLISKKEEKK